MCLFTYEHLSSFPLIILKNYSLATPLSSQDLASRESCSTCGLGFRPNSISLIYCLNQEHFYLPGDIHQYLQTFFKGGRRQSGLLLTTQSVEARDVPRHLQRRGQSPSPGKKKLSGQNISSTDIETLDLLSSF